MNDISKIKDKLNDKDKEINELKEKIEGAEAKIMRLQDRVDLLVSKGQGEGGSTHLDTGGASLSRGSSAFPSRQEILLLGDDDLSRISSKALNNNCKIRTINGANIVLAEVLGFRKA